jgi:hypothetical protein
MSWFLSPQSKASQPAGQRAGEMPDHDGHAGGYLTDGVELYRSLGAISVGPSRMIGLENCRSMDAVLIAVDELRRRRLRPVIPAT